MATKQELFDTAVRGLASQSFQQSKNRNSCMYRGRAGRKCAVGHLISDVEYEREMEGKTASFAVRKLSIAKYSTWLEELQVIHDCCKSQGNMVQKLYVFARIEGLDTEVLNNLGLTFNN